ncbi:uncharacterized protein CcaverHIS019_0408240 [Cutaneotrichosporon cavernicola]|uniref:Glycosyl transferase CAP10 domain-containing protein n=1 Tax=Cutaneotrichosporon cavernicola TaxID=279322 RepID=A0AA48L4U4_9TREE|nr:uncharacterized protein CcaverHIS019_0408240 [Cutaneotrichosporon cavernicola]BEI92004.1 hypothetical protein CcaverHIS019_0408240 [Cutaneotrichosporon cavernicola]BEI99774.1 hypothetical protein CcaverHIS631_0408170 [Cutaneotrichosporon cavernicola]BEJ07550.1 hypothetical protein CcaverHIS641_0408190 [Cutaneotrichosporon cavernicola]
MPPLNRYLGLVFIIAIVVTLHFLFFSPSPLDLSVIIPAGSRTRPPPNYNPGLAPGHGSPQAVSLGQPVAAMTHHPLQTLNDDLLPNDLEFDERGLLTFDSDKHNGHPVELLIERAKLIVAAMEERISKVDSIQAAVADYKAAYGMVPPRGFDAWFKYTQETKAVSASSLLSMAQKPFVQYLSLSGPELRKRIDTEATNELMFSFTFVPNGEGDMGTECDSEPGWFPEDYSKRGRGRVKVNGASAWKFRCNNTLSLLLPVLKHLPDEFFTMSPPVTMLFHTDDGPRGQVHHGFQTRAESMGKVFKTWSPQQLEAAENAMRWTSGWQWTCPDDSPLKRSEVDIVLNDMPLHQTAVNRKDFVADYNMAMDVCYNPNLRDLQSAALLDMRFSNVPLAPYVSQCRTLRSSDIVAVPLDGAWDEPQIIPWTEKKPMVFWRGSATGLYHDLKFPWQKSQRERLHTFANNMSDITVPVLVDSDGDAKTAHFRVKDMSTKWFDIGLAGGPVQCNDKDGSCERLDKAFKWRTYVNKEESVANKFVVDVDGNAWSSRFRRLLASNNVVMKASMYPEWLSQLLVPWYHYVPVRADYSDIYDIMAFFDGAPDRSTKGRDDLAEEIAKNALHLTKTRWRDQDMASFMLLMMLEYWRMLHDDREAGSFRLGRTPV